MFLQQIEQTSLILEVVERLIFHGCPDIKRIETEALEKQIDSHLQAQ